jgi:hypothetical protein
VVVLRRGLYSNCHNVNANATAVGGIYGYSHTCGGYDGGQSEYVRVPFADVGPSLIPEWMSDEDAVLLTDARHGRPVGTQHPPAAPALPEQLRVRATPAHPRAAALTSV